MWGRGLRGNNGACYALCQISVTSLATHNHIRPFWCWFPVCGFVYILGPCGSLQWPLLWGWEFLPPQPPTDFYSQRFWGFSFLHWIPGLCGLSPGLPAVALSTGLHNLPPCWVFQPPICHESSLPCCLSPPILLVWMIVCSLTPWLLDFHTVRFSVSSGCFLFLNCCCPFGCGRKHSVSTYASILAGSYSTVLNLKSYQMCA